MDLELLHRHALLYMNTVLSFLIVTEHDAQRLAMKRVRLKSDLLSHMMSEVNKHSL